MTSRNAKGTGPVLSHVQSDGKVGMVDVGAKPVTQREAVARAFVELSPEVLRLVEKNALAKGDVLATAQIAGILAAKQTATLIPLTHPLPLTFVGVECRVRRRAGGIEITGTVRCEGKTGAEMEAMTACSVAALTVYDMCKSADHAIAISRVELLRKSGGKSGVWKRRPGR